MSFKSPFFKFNGKSSRDFQLRICQVGTKDSTSPFGLARTIEKETDYGFSTSIKSIKYNDVTIDLTLVKTDGNIALPFSEDEKFEIISWLFQDDFKPFISDDDESKIYYVLFTKGSNYQNALKQGYINLTMQLNAPCAFSPINTGYFVVDGEQLIEITNKTNVGTYSEPDLEFQLLGETTSFKIENLNTGDVMSFEGLEKGSHVQCYNEGMKQVICVNDPSMNLRKFMVDKKWLRLARGVNHLRITTESAKVAIVGQSKIALS